MANSTCLASRLWVGRNECDDISVSGILLISIVSGWLLLFILSGIRLVYLTNSAAKNTDVAKKLQFFQAWFYSLFYTLVSFTSLLLTISLIMEGQYAAGVCMIVFNVLSVAYSSQIDVIGTVGKSQGVNDIDTLTMLQYFSTIYLAKAVWKLSGHKERESADSAEEQTEPGGFSSLLCFGELRNNRRPRVYDFKDVVGIQGAFLSLPTILVLFISYVRAYGKDSYNAETGTFDFNSFNIIDVPLFLVIISFISALLTPLLGDWETLKKNTGHSIGSLFLRFSELAARVLFYAFFIDVSRFIALLALGFEFFVMWFTMINARDSSSAGRTDTISHKILASWDAIFFVRFRRVHVDKEFVLKNNTLMPYTIEFLRFGMKVLITAVGYLVIVVNKSETYVLGNDANSNLPIMLYASILFNLLVFVFNLSMFCFKRKELKGADLSKLWSYWLTLQPCKLLFTPAVVHVNRDNINFGAGGEPIHYV